MDLAVENVRRSHRMHMNLTIRQSYASNAFNSIILSKNPEMATVRELSNSSLSNERVRFKTIEKNGCIKFVQQKQVAVPRSIFDKKQTNSVTQCSIKHKRSISHIQLRSDVEVQAMKMKLEEKVEQARSKLDAMRQGFQRCLEKKQEIISNMRNSKIATRNAR